MIKFQTVALQLYRKETPTYMFSQESPKRFKNAYFAEHLLMAAYETSFKNQVVTLDKLLLLSYLLRSIEKTSFIICIIESGQETKDTQFVVSVVILSRVTSRVVMSNLQVFI